MPVVGILRRFLKLAEALKSGLAEIEPFTRAETDQYVGRFECHLVS